jgi:hypothetical protein
MLCTTKLANLFAPFMSKSCHHVQSSTQHFCAKDDVHHLHTKVSTAHLGDPASQDHQPACLTMPISPGVLSSIHTGHSLHMNHLWVTARETQRTVPLNFQSQLVYTPHQATTEMLPLSPVYTRKRMQGSACMPTTSSAQRYSATLTMVQ